MCNIERNLMKISSRRAFFSLSFSLLLSFLRHRDSARIARRAINSVFNARDRVLSGSWRRKIIKYDLSGYRDALVRSVKTRKIRAVAVAEIFMKAYSGMMLIPISDINLDARGIH